jgi:hypothetical protein
MSELNWYVAEYVIAVDFNGDIPHEYRIENFVIKATSADDAYQKASALMLTRSIHLKMSLVTCKITRASDFISWISTGMQIMAKSFTSIRQIY